MSIVVSKIDSPFNISIDNIASDKSISHRCAIFSLLSDKKSIIKNYLFAEDTLATLDIIQKLGATVLYKQDKVIITPPKNIKEPSEILDCKNSGTGMRLLAGFLAGFANGVYILSGDKYLNIRPMGRIINPLKSIGANIFGRDNNRFAPIVILKSNIKSFDFKSKLASAQVKSCMILTALSLDKSSFYSEPELSRDHTERMLRAMGADIKTNRDKKIEIRPIDSFLKPLDINIPADPSSAFFFAVLATITKNSRVVLKNILLNPTRIEAYNVLKKMGANIKFIELENIYEPIGDIVVEYGKLQGVVIEDNISWLIDEIPALAIAAIFASSSTIIKNAKELRAKESDRISCVVKNLRLCGVRVIEFDDGFEVFPSKLQNAKVDSFGDHRIAMSFAIAGAVSGMKIVDTDCINTSFPDFIKILSKIVKVV